MRRRLDRPRVGSNQTLFDLLPIRGFASTDESLQFLAVNAVALKRYAYAVGNSRRRLQAVFDNALDAILLVNDDAQFIDANPAACALFGRSRDQMLTLKVWDITPPAGLAEGLESWTTFRAEGSLEGEYHILTGDDSIREVEYRAVAGVLPGVHLAIVRDVTARNAARRESEGKLHALNAQLQKVSARARARREEDRARLARELHDQLGQALVGLKIDLCWLRDRARVERAAEEIDVMTDLVDDTIMRVRRLSSELRPPVLDRLGLVAAIEWQAEEFQRRYDIHVDVRTDSEHVPLDHGRSTAIYRIFQEILTNVAAHARASSVSIGLTVVDGTLRLVVTDDGCGISQATIDSEQSLGLIGTRERAALLGGEVVIQPATPRGTCVSVAVPLAERRQSVRDPW
jgi:PAS domain S-box-containing protein